MSNKKKRRALKRTETTTWIDELKELDPASLKMLEETIVRPRIPDIDANKTQKYTDVISVNHGISEGAMKLGKYTGVVMGARPFPSIMASIKLLQEIEADCPKVGQMLDGYEVIGGMWVHDHYIVQLKPRRK